MTIHSGLVAQFVGLAIAGTATDAPAGHPVRETFGIVVAAAVAALRDSLPAKLAAPNDQRRIEEPSLLEIGQEGSDRAVDFRPMDAEVFLHAVVGIPVLLLVAAAVVNLNEANTPLDQSTGDEALATEGRGPEGQRVIVGARLIYTVALQSGGRFLRQVEGIRGAALEFKGQLIARDSGLQFTEPGTRGQVPGIKSVEGGDGVTLNLGR